jgi:hypothetical protein
MATVDEIRAGLFQSEIDLLGEQINVDRSAGAIRKDLQVAQAIESGAGPDLFGGAHVSVDGKQFNPKFFDVIKPLDKILTFFGADSVLPSAGLKEELAVAQQAEARQKEVDAITEAAREGALTNTFGLQESLSLALL